MLLAWCPFPVLVVSPSVLPYCFCARLILKQLQCKGMTQNLSSTRLDAHGILKLSTHLLPLSIIKGKIGAAKTSVH